MKIIKIKKIYAVNSHFVRSMGKMGGGVFQISFLEKLLLKVLTKPYFLVNLFEKG